MRLERAGGGATSNVVEHRRFHFEETAVLEEAADFGDHLRALHEQCGAVGIAHQVEVALAVLDLAVGHAVPLVGHRPQRFGKHGELVELHRRLAGFGEKCFAFDADPVAAIEAFPSGHARLVERLDVHVALDAPQDVGKLEKARLAHVAQCSDAASDLDVLPFGEIRPQIGRRGRHFEARAVRVDAEFAQFREFLAANGDQFGFGGLRLRWGEGFTHV